MKQNIAARENSDETTPSQLEPGRQPDESQAPMEIGIPKNLRRLQWNEVVSHGDFVHDRHQNLTLWEGPNGFQADSFVNPIYRPNESQPIPTGEIKPSRPGEKC